MDTKHAQAPREALPVLGPETWRPHALFIHETIQKRWVHYTPEDLHFTTLATAGEVGEAQNIIKKDWRGDPGEEGRWLKLANELADVRIYLELIAHMASYTFGPFEIGDPLGDGVTQDTMRKVAMQLGIEMGTLAEKVLYSWEGGVPEDHYLHPALWRVQLRLYELARLAAVDLDWACGLKVRECYERWPETKEKGGVVFHTPAEYSGPHGEPIPHHRLHANCQIPVLSFYDHRSTGLPMEPEEVVSVIDYVRYYMDAPAWANPLINEDIRTSTFWDMRRRAHQMKDLDGLKDYLEEIGDYGWNPLE